MRRLQSGPQEAPSVVQGEPASGARAGQPARTGEQAHAGGSIVWHTGYGDPPRQGLQVQRLPSPYQHVRVESVHGPVAPARVGHAAGSGGALQSWPGVVTCQRPDPSHRAVVRHPGRGSAPQEQCADVDVGDVTGPASPGGHGEPSAGGVPGQALPPAPPVLPPPVPASRPPVPAPPSCLPTSVVPPQQRAATPANVARIRREPPRMGSMMARGAAPVEGGGRGSPRRITGRWRGTPRCRTWARCRRGYRCCCRTLPSPGSRGRSSRRPPGRC